MFSSIVLRRLALIACTGLAASGLAACGAKAQAASPSALTGDPTTYDGQTVSVSGTAKDPKVRQLRRGGTAVMYQLCDTQCIHVFQFGDQTITDGTPVSVTGTFHASFGRVRQISNVLMVGTRPGGGHWGGGQGPPSAAPSGGASAGPG